jgi:hypothetical protein
MRAALLVLPGCVVQTTLPADSPCEQVFARYASRVYTCSQDPDRAERDTAALREAHTCAITDWTPDDTGWSGGTHALMVGGDAVVSIESAWYCSEILIEMPCDRLLALDPSGSWLEGLSRGCAAIFDGPGEETTPYTFPYTTPGTTTSYGYYWLQRAVDPEHAPEVVEDRARRLVPGPADHQVGPAVASEVGGQVE